MIFFFLQICFTITISNDSHKGELIIPEGSSEIKNEEYYGCSKLSGSLIIPDSVKHIGKYSFYNCYGFTGNLKLPKNIISIGEYAFYNCHGFTGSLTISDTCTRIGIYSFYNCSGFTSLSLPSRLHSISSHSFSDCSGFRGSLSIGASTTKIEKYAFAGCSGFDQTLTFSDNLIKIEEGAFFGCSGFTGRVEFKNVKAIEKYAFYGCSSIESVSLRSFTKVGEKSFFKCRKLSENKNHLMIIGASFGDGMHEAANSVSGKKDNSKLNVFLNKLGNCKESLIVVFVVLIIAAAMCCFEADNSSLQNDQTTGPAIVNSIDNGIVAISEQKEERNADVETIKKDDKNAHFASLHDINQPRYNNMNYIPKVTGEVVDTKPNSYYAPPPPNYPSSDDDGDKVAVDLSSTEED